MRQLLLMRHAKAAPDDPSGSDHARPLNERGRRGATAMRAVLRDLALVPDVVLVSSARRTVQTLEALAPWDETPLIEPMNQLYLANAQQILQVLATVSETVRSVMVVGHNPGLHELSLALVGTHAMTLNGDNTRRLAAAFPPGAFVEFTIARSWRTLGNEGGEGGGRLVRFVSPRDLPEMAS